VVRGVRTRTTTLATIVWRTKAFVRPRAEPSWNTLLRKFVHATRGAAVDLPTFGDALRSLEVVVAAERAAGIG
jgi:predicted dehydrogenase